MYVKKNIQIYLLYIFTYPLKYFTVEYHNTHLNSESILD